MAQRFRFPVIGLFMLTCLWAQQPAGPAKVKIYNNIGQKLAAGKHVIGGTVTSPDPNMYCAMANAGYDFLWIEMQHSTLTYADAARMIRSCPGAAAVPFIRVPDATEGDIQKATDIGALGIIVPTVDTVEKAQAAVRWSRYPPDGRRSQGLGQYGALYGTDYRQTANANIMVVIMIETPIGVDNIEKIAAVPGIDVIFAASSDLGNFSGHKQGEPEYEAMVKRIHDVVTQHKIWLAGPQAWRGRPDFVFFQGPADAQLLRLGVEASLKQPAKPGVAATEGTEKH